MIYTIVRQTAADFDKWHDIFDEAAPLRKEFGATGSHQIFRDMEDPNTMTVIIEWANAEKAGEFLNSPALKEAMQKAGVIGAPLVRTAATRM